MGLAAVDDLVGVPVVEVVLGQVDVDGVGVFFEDGGDEETGSVEELEVLGEGVGVGGVVVEDGGEGGCAVLVGAVHGRVHVVEEAVADLNGLLGGFGDGGPAVEFLPGGAVLVVVAVEGVEGAEGRPAGAQLLGGGAGEAAHVGADHVELEEGREGEHATDGFAVFLPRGHVVAEPVADFGAGSQESAAGDDEGTQTGAAGQHGALRGNGHERAVHVVEVVHGDAGLRDDVRVDGVVGDAALVGVPVIAVGGLVVDGVFGVEEVAVGEAELVALGAGEDQVGGGEGGLPVGVGGCWEGTACGGCGAAVDLELARPAGEVARGLADGRRVGREADGGFVGVVAGEVAGEVGGLVHVDPEGVNVDASVLVEEVLELAGPVGVGGLGKPVGEDGDAGPDDAKPDGAVGAQEEGVLFDSAVQRGVVLVGHGRVNHDDVVLVVGVQVGDEGAHLVERVALRVEGEDAATVHVVNVGPHGLEGDAGLGVVVDDLGDLKGVLVAVAAVVVAQSPVGLHGGGSGDGAVLLDGFDGGLAGEEVEVEDAAEGVVLEVLGALGVLVDHDVHAVRVYEEHAVGARRAVVQVEGVRAVQVGVVGDAEAVLVPERADVLVRLEVEGIRVLAESVQVGVGGQLGAQAQVLRLEDKRGRRGVEQDFVAALDAEAEGRCRVFELEVRGGGGRGARGAGEDGFRDLVDLVVFVLDLDVKAVVCIAISD